MLNLFDVSILVELEDFFYEALHYRAREAHFNNFISADNTMERYSISVAFNRSNMVTNVDVAYGEEQSIVQDILISNFFYQRVNRSRRMAYIRF